MDKNLLKEIAAAAVAEYPFAQLAARMAERGWRWADAPHSQAIRAPDEARLRATAETLVDLLAEDSVPGRWVSTGGLKIALGLDLKISLRHPALRSGR